MKLFKETQKFDQWWLKLILVSVSIATLLPLYMMYREDTFVNESSWVVFLLTGITFAAIILVLVLRLVTKINAQGIQYRFFPFPEYQIPWRDIEKCYVREYSPLKEFGGWGIRFGLNGRAFNVKGNIGIQVVLKSGKKILFGTQNETEAERVIEACFKK